MFTSNNAFSSFSTNDIQAAKNFYGKTLGLNVADETMGAIALTLPQGGRVIIYPKPDHEPATFTILNFLADDLEQTVDELTAKGIKFEQYGGDIQTDAKGIFRGKGEAPDAAWFKDPAGNILSVMKP